MAADEEVPRRASKAETARSACERGGTVVVKEEGGGADGRGGRGGRRGARSGGETMQRAVRAPGRRWSAAVQDLGRSGSRPGVRERSGVGEGIEVGPGEWASRVGPARWGWC
jgi:hypothetical protein